MLKAATMNQMVMLFAVFIVVVAMVACRWLLVINIIIDASIHFTVRYFIVSMSIIP